MRKWINKHPAWVGVVLICAFLTVAAMPRGVNRMTSLWVGDLDDSTTNITVDSYDDTNHAYIKGSLEVDGTIYADGGITDTTGGVTAGEIADVVRSITLFINSFFSEVGGGEGTVGTSAVPLSDSTTPGFEIDDNLVSLVWADGETSPVQIKFRVPPDYSSGGAFRALVSASGTDTPALDFDVYINSDGLATGFDSSATGQTPVNVDTTANVTPDEITLSVLTDFASLAAGDWVTLRLWRDNADASSADLELKGIEFYYTASQ